MFFRDALATLGFFCNKGWFVFRNDNQINVLLRQGKCGYRVSSFGLVGMDKKPGNILLVSNYSSDTAYAWWLMEFFWVSIAEEFVKSGRKVYLAYPKITSLSEVVVASPIECVEMVMPWRNGNERLVASKLIRDRNISLIYFTDQPYFNLKYLYMRRYGVTRIIVHDHTPGDRPPVVGLKGLVKSVRNALPWVSADRVFCVSDYMRKRNIENSRIPSRKCVVIQNGIFPIDCSKRKTSGLRVALELRSESLLVITTGRAHPYKRFDFIIECASELRKMSVDLDVVFLLVGDGPALVDLQMLITKLDLVDTVLLLGYRNDVRDLLCMSDVALHAALGEGFSLSIVEYMSAGLPVLVPDITSVCQAIMHEKTGLIYTSGDASEVASYIIGLSADKDRRRKLGDAAKAEADACFSIDGSREGLLDAIREILH